jgi:aerobic-type carbon monoxide dehydrogenase small subunit (CoxS/CutS family)
MKVRLILNGDDIDLSGEPRDSLFAVLQQRAGLFPERVCCEQGDCGRCHVVLDGKEVPSCLIPFFQVREQEVVSPEGFQNTEEYRQFRALLEEEGLVHCTECTEVQIFHLFSFLEQFPQADAEECRLVIGEIPCRCGSKPVLERGARRWLASRPWPALRREAPRGRH